METKVFIAACPDYSEEAVQKSVERIFDHYGGAQAFLRYGSKVAIKPNLLMPRSPDGVTTTHPEVVACVAKLFVNAGAQVSIVESSGGPYNDLVLNLLYKRCGMEKAAERSGAALNHDCSSKTVRAVSGERDFDILTPLLRPTSSSTSPSSRPISLPTSPARAKICSAPSRGSKKRFIIEVFPTNTPLGRC